MRTLQHTLGVLLEFMSNPRICLNKRLLINGLHYWHDDCFYIARQALLNQETKMKSVDRMNMYDLATAFIAFGMVLGFAVR